MGAETLPPCPICGRQPKLLIHYDAFGAGRYTLVCERWSKSWSHRVAAHGAPDEFVAAKQWRKLVGKRNTAGGSA